MVIVDEQGAIEWKFDMPASDGWVLPDGHVLLALYGTKQFPNGELLRSTREKRQDPFPVPGQQKEISTVQPFRVGSSWLPNWGLNPGVVINRKGRSSGPHRCGVRSRISTCRRGC
ncbi:MAG: hypothetical protein Ct9H300mP1_28480 [Planctomycetaceae bacterium]|nr:MAG: hypothetical protein Ct9H300mP1_28480 [Planctomycetaceae bacterium]